MVKVIILISFKQSELGNAVWFWLVQVFFYWCAECAVLVKGCILYFDLWHSRCRPNIVGPVCSWRFLVHVVALCVWCVCDVCVWACVWCVCGVWVCSKTYCCWWYNYWSKIWENVEKVNKVLIKRTIPLLKSYCVVDLYSCFGGGGWNSSWTSELSILYSWATICSCLLPTERGVGSLQGGW